jgi:hypothetical protein
MGAQRPIIIGCLIFLVSQFWLKGSALNHSTSYEKERQLESLSLEDILLHLAQYCDKFGDSVLFFRCNEEIEETINTPAKIVKPPGVTFMGKIEKNRFVYDYQLIRKEREIREQRILVEENGTKRNDPDAPLKLKRTPYHHLIAGPIGLFSQYWQQFYDYRIEGADRVHGERAVIIEVTPKPNQEIENLYGKAWVRKSDFSVLKIEYNQKSMNDYEEIRALAEKSKLVPDITIITEFAFEKNGIRFPSRCSISESYAKIDRPEFKYNKSKLTVTYSNYQFFTVETEVVIKRSQAQPEKLNGLDVLLMEFPLPEIEPGTYVFRLAAEDKSNHLTAETSKEFKLIK